MTVNLISHPQQSQAGCTYQATITIANVSDMSHHSPPSQISDMSHHSPQSQVRLGQEQSVCWSERPGAADQEGRPVS